MDKKYHCKNIGCRASFTWPMQVARHKLKCTFHASSVEQKYKLVDGKYQCSKCKKSFTHQASSTRHTKINCLKKKKEFKCSVCNKLFIYKSLFQKHERFHENLARQKCKHCKQVFRRSDLFIKHIQSCSIADYTDVDSDHSRSFYALLSIQSSSVPTDSESIQINHHSVEDNVPECFDHDVDFNNDSIVVEAGDSIVSEVTSELSISNIDAVDVRDNLDSSRNEYLKNYRDITRRSKNLENILYSEVIITSQKGCTQKCFSESSREQL